MQVSEAERVLTLQGGASVTVMVCEGQGINGERTPPWQGWGRVEERAAIAG